jgi:hypothetical protein
MSLKPVHGRSEEPYDDWRVRFAVWAGLYVYVLTKDPELSLAVASFVLASLQDRR